MSSHSMPSTIQSANFFSALTSPPKYQMWHALHENLGLLIAFPEDPRTWDNYLNAGINLSHRDFDILTAYQMNPIYRYNYRQEWVLQQHCVVCFYSPATRFVLRQPKPKARTLVPCRRCGYAAHCGGCVSYSAVLCQNLDVFFSSCLLLRHGVFSSSSNC